MVVCYIDSDIIGHNKTQDVQHLNQTPQTQKSQTKPSTQEGRIPS